MPISKFSVDSAVSLVIHACLLNSCIGHYVGNHHVNIAIDETNEFARNFCAQALFMYLNASTYVKISTCLETNGWG